MFFIFIKRCISIWEKTLLQNRISLSDVNSWDASAPRYIFGSQPVKNDTRNLGSINEVNETVLDTYIKELITFGIRPTGSLACQQAGEYITSKLVIFGLDVSAENWTFFLFHSQNVVATFWQDIEWKIQGYDTPLIGRHTIKVYVITESGQIARNQIDVYCFTFSHSYFPWLGPFIYYILTHLWKVWCFAGSWGYGPLCSTRYRQVTGVCWCSDELYLASKDND